MLGSCYTDLSSKAGIAVTESSNALDRDPVLGDLIRSLPRCPADDEAFFTALRAELAHVAPVEPSNCATPADRKAPRRSWLRRTNRRLGQRYAYAGAVTAVLFVIAISLGMLAIGHRGDSPAVSFSPAQGWESSGLPIAGGSKSRVTLVAIFRRPALGVTTSRLKPARGNPRVRELQTGGIFLRVSLPPRLVAGGLPADVRPHFAEWAAITPRRVTGASTLTEYRLPGSWGHFRVWARVYFASAHPTEAERAGARAELARMTVGRRS